MPGGKMRLLQIYFLIIVFAVCGCATDKSIQQDEELSNSQGNSDFGDTSANADSNPPADSNTATDSTPPTEASPETQTPDQSVSTSQDSAAASKTHKSENVQNPEANANSPSQPPPPAVEEPPSQGGSTEKVSSEPNQKPATVTALDFNSNLNGGTVILKTNRLVNFTTRKNESTNQFIVELQNTLVPKRFRRPYTTKEFPGAVASINAYQAKGAPKVARIIIQLRQAMDPDVQQNGKIITVASSGASPSPSIATTQNQTKQEASPSETTFNDEDAQESQTSNGDSAKKESDNIQGSDEVADQYLSGNSKFYGRPISLEVKDADIRDVLRLISEESGVNLIIQDDVTGKITIKLRRVPWDQALLVVLKSKQLGYVKEGNILRITQERTIELESDAAKKVIESRRDLLPLHVKVFPISYAASMDLEIQVKDFLSSRGKVHSDKRTNTLVVTDIDEVLSKVNTLVKRLDSETPQVLIEAKVIEARESYHRLIGVNWSFNGTSTNLSPNSAGVMSTYTPRLTVQPVTAQQSAIGDLGIAFGNLDFFGNLDASLKLLESENLVKIISAPRIVTLDRQKAQIDQTTQFPIFGSTVSPSGAAQPSITFQDIKLELDVTPQISSDGGITLDINVLREFAEAPEFTSSGNSARPKDSRHAQTRVLVPNGDTIVIGGIYQSDVTEGESGIPWLRSIPVLGALFRQRNVEREKNELVIFITPRILNREKTYAAEGDGS
jgi:type IV pilus assembly protein PilQ